jgi:hypothetical protein
MLRAAPPTTRTAASGHCASGGPTARQASAMLSLALASSIGSIDSGTGTSMASAYGTRSRSQTLPPHDPIDAPKP